MNLLAVLMKLATKGCKKTPGLPFQAERDTFDSVIPVIDLFAGPGGLGEGFSSVEETRGRRVFRIALSIEMEEFAHRTLQLRSFYRQFKKSKVPEEYYDTLRGKLTLEGLYGLHKSEAEVAAREAWQAKLGDVDPEEVDRRISEALKGCSGPWVLIGGPPCQAYSLVGRSRVRSADPVKFEKDPRHFLYKEYLRILAKHQPHVFVMENVKGILSSTVAGERIVDHIMRDLADPVNALSPGAQSKVKYKLYPLAEKDTVEGLTVSYYRRRAGAADTLMQMGRWFGFRNGYKDLVRLYIGKNEPENKKHTKFINLYEAFRATCHDEEQFRAQLVRYSSPDFDGHITTPKQVPPLVTQHMLQPTSRNKMFNARITFKNLGGETRQKTVAPTDQETRKHNENLTRSLLSHTKLRGVDISLPFQKNSYKVIITQFDPGQVIKFLSQYQWLRGFEKSMAEVLDYLNGKDDLNPEIDSWLFFAPQLKSGNETWTAAAHDFSVRTRERVETGGRYKVYSEPDHIKAAEFFAGLSDAAAGKGSELRKPRQAVFLFYPVRSLAEKGETPTMGFVLVFPKNRIPKQIAYTVADPSRSEAVVVDVPSKD